MRAALRARLTSWAVIAAGKHLFPFRTEKLSPLAPMVLGEQSPGRVGRRPFLPQTGPARGPSRFRRARLQAARSFSRQSGSSDRRRRTRSPTGGCVANSDARPSSANGFDRVERLGRRAEPANATSSVACSSREQRVGEPVRRVAELGGEPVGVVLALRREQEVHERRGDRREHEEQRPLEEAADA